MAFMLAREFIRSRQLDNAASLNNLVLRTEAAGARNWPCFPLFFAPEFPLLVFGGHDVGHAPVLADRDNDERER